jgi:aryl-alcohol dehydrogenase
MLQGIEALGELGFTGVAGAPPFRIRADFDVNSLLLNGKSIRGLIEGDEKFSFTFATMPSSLSSGRF